jgi:hypothetical protein
MAQQRRQQPKPNVIATLGGNSTFPWVTLRSFSESLVSIVGDLSTLLSQFDSGLEVVVTDDALGLRVQPKSGMTRSRSELFAEVRKLARVRSEWRVKWESD